jgi:hypothetical protein
LAKKPTGLRRGCILQVRESWRLPVIAGGPSGSTMQDGTKSLGKS